MNLPLYDAPWLLEASLRLSVVLGLLLISRPLLRRAIGSRWLSMLWLVLLVRLLAPWPVESRWSLSTKPRAVDNASWKVRVQVAEPSIATRVASPQHAFPAISRSDTKPVPWSTMWLTGATIGFAMLGLRMRRTIRLRALAEPATDERLRAIFASLPPAERDGVELLETDALSVPTLSGVWRRQIWMPRSWLPALTDGELRHVLLHELGHANRRDLAVQWLFSLAVCVHWFNPLVWLAARCAQADREMACDAWVLARCDGATPEEYGATLLKSISLLRPPLRLAPAAVAMAASKRGLFTRISTLGACRARPFWCGAAGALGLLAALVTVTTSPLAAQAPVPAVSAAPAAAATGERAPAVVAPKPAEPAAATPAAAGPAPEDQVEIASVFFEVTGTALRKAAREKKDLDDLFSSTLAPGAPGGGVRTRTQAQTVRLMASLNQVRGIDLLNAPRVTTRSGQRATVEIIREFRYATEFTPDDKKPPNLTPSAFETRNVGTTLEVEAAIRPDRATIDLQLVPQVVNLVGLNKIGPGGAINAVKVPHNPGAFWTMGAIPGVKLGPGESIQPVFSTRKISTRISLRDGYTVLLGGLRQDGDVDGKGKNLEPRLLFCLISARIVSPDGTPRTTSGVSSPDAAAAPTFSSPPVATPVPGKPGFAISPFAPDQGYVDVREFSRGAEVKCPYTGKTFIVP